MPDALLIFIKNPELGKAKTRIAKTLGDVAALQVYKDLLTEVKVLTEATDVRRQLWYSSYIDEQDDWDAAHFHKKLQHKGDLGERMRHAFETAFAEGAERVVIIGSDCPFITPVDLEVAFAALHASDTVIGPTFDGGYYLLGMRCFMPALFENIAWSTESVFEATIRAIEAAGCTHTTLRRLRDIDYEEDLKYLKGYHRG